MNQHACSAFLHNTIKLKSAGLFNHRCSTSLSYSLTEAVRGLSVNTVIRYSRNFSVTAHLRARSSSFLEEQFSMFHSASLRTRLTYTFGLTRPSCSWGNVTPSPSLETTTYTKKGLLKIRQADTGGLVNTCLRLSNTSWHSLRTGSK